MCCSHIDDVFTPMTVVWEKSFTQTDPLAADVGSAYPSAYVYAGNNPAMYTDPSGLRLQSASKQHRDPADGSRLSIAGCQIAFEPGFRGAGKTLDEVRPKMPLGADLCERNINAEIRKQLRNAVAVESSLCSPQVNPDADVRLACALNSRDSTRSGQPPSGPRSPRSRKAKATKALANEVPAYAGKKTAGTLVRPGGSEEVLESGWHPPASAMPKGTPGMNIVTKSHVEAHAAAIMRNEGLVEATLWINRAPCGGVAGCAALLPRMVPTGATLTIQVVPEGSLGTVVETIVIVGVG
jgi:SCP1.201-like deaminase